MAVLDVLHRKMDRVSIKIFKPAEKPNEQIRMLEMGQPGIQEFRSPAYILQFNQGFDLLNMELLS